MEQARTWREEEEMKTRLKEKVYACYSLHCTDQDTIECVAKFRIGR